MTAYRFSQPVSWRSLATYNGHARSELLALFPTHPLDVEIPVDDTENVHLLALVLVDTLDLDVEESCRVDGVTSRLLDVFGKADLVGILDLLPFLAELLVIHKLFERGELGEIAQIVEPADL